MSTSPQPRPRKRKSSPSPSKHSRKSSKGDRSSRHSSSRDSKRRKEEKHDKDDDNDMRQQEARLIRLAGAKGLGDVRVAGRVVWADDVAAEHGKPSPLFKTDSKLSPLIGLIFVPLSIHPRTTSMVNCIGWTCLRIVVINLDSPAKDRLATARSFTLSPHTRHFICITHPFSRTKTFLLS